MTTILGGKGQGKSYLSLMAAELIKGIRSTTEPEVAVITDEEMKELNKPARQYFATANTFVGNGGSSGSYTPISPQPYQPSYEYDTPHWNHSPVTTPILNIESKKQEFSPEDYRSKFCAVVTITFIDESISNPLEHTGVLFVRKCGHWKLCDYSGNKLAGGTAGSFERDLEKGRMKIEVHKMLYDADYVEPETGIDDLEIIGINDLEI